MDRFDFAIVGSGFAGSILAMGLVKSGYKVCLLEKNAHPRFAIGESSTPIADMILRDLSQKYELHFLKEISRYGEWQRNHPDVICGLKRGFSYYRHTKGEFFKGDPNHTNDLLVAASVDNENSDTNWLRSDVDHFLVKKAVETGVCYRDQAAITDLQRTSEPKKWLIGLNTGIEKKIVIEAEWIIDATGSPGFSNQFFGTTVTAEPFFTDSGAIYTHMTDVIHWSDYLAKSGHYTADYPYNPDHSALHHLIDEGWIWMLRFNQNLLSCGVLLEGSMRGAYSNKPPEQSWNRIIQSYPSLRQIFSKGAVHTDPGQFFRTERLQRLLSHNHGEGWIALNHTVGFVDPMHSTGIAHSLKGVEDILSLFSEKGAPDHDVQKSLDRLYEVTRKEILLVDKLVSMSYQSRHDFSLFHAAVMIYFVATVQYEKRRLKGDKPEAFLCADDAQIEELVTQAHREMRSLQSDASPSVKKHFLESLKMRIKPLNHAGLMDASKKNMYRHTAVTL